MASSSNPTYFLEDPVNGDQILQQDRRWIFGGRFEKTIHAFANFDSIVGSEIRYDAIPKVGVDHTVANRFLSPISMNSIREGSLSPYADVSWKLLDGLRLMGGVREDVYLASVTAKGPLSSSGARTAATFSPKMGVAYQLLSDVEIYGNWGKGFHSNDARAAVRTDVNIPLLVRGTGKELGLRYQTRKVTLTAAYWWLSINSELKFVGDSNSVEPSNASMRRGYEITGFWRPAPWLALDAVWTGSRARFLDVPGAEYVPGALEHVGEFGVSAIFERYELSTRTRYIGGYPLIEDNSVRARAEIEVSFRAAWKPTGRLTIYAELLNALNHRGKDIEYLYTSRLPGEPYTGIDGTLSRIEEPRTLRIGIKFNG